MGSKFQFRLAAVLKHRKVSESLAQAAYQSGLAYLHELEAELEEMLMAISRAQVERAERVDSGKARGPELLAIHDFLTGQDLRIHRQRKQIDECRAEVEKLQDILRQKAIDVKIVEKVREKKLQEFKDEVKKRETKILDDLNGMAWIERSKSGSAED